MRRPISPPATWQAITALAGIFTVFFALAAPVDLWRITVQSLQGQPLRAVALMSALPQEHLTDACLSLGSEADAPGSDLPLLRSARLRLDRSGTMVEIRTEEAIQVPALALTLRVQCPGAPVYARHFRVLIPPPASQTADLTRVGRGLHLRLRPGDTVESVAKALFPTQRRLRQNMVAAVIAGNPALFPDGHSRIVAPGTILWFPDPRDLKKSTWPALVPMTPAPRPAHEIAAEHRPPIDVPPLTKAPMRVVARTPTQRQAPVSVGKPAPHDCAPSLGREPAARALEERTRGVESDLTQVRQAQAGFDAQVTRLEQSLQGLRTAVAAVPTCAATQAASESAVPGPKPEIRVVVQTEAMPWYFWLGSAAFAIAAAAAGFAYARRRMLVRALAENDEPVERRRPTTVLIERQINSPPRAAGAAAPAPTKKSLRRQFDSPPPPSASRVVPEPARESAKQPSGLSRELLHEMDRALDNTRSMFTDVDRFIALGRIKNALSLLKFQMEKDPNDRDLWIKLMAVYRQEKMDVELEHTAREFLRHFASAG